uniref:Secreted protein n=1 Tax=Ascaris lumbricoides TaxID=6252 RepID=A0A0M3ICV6_ASCLU
MCSLKYLKVFTLDNSVTPNSDEAYYIRSADVNRFWSNMGTTRWMVRPHAQCSIDGRQIPSSKCLELGTVLKRLSATSMLTQTKRGGSQT